MKSITMAGFGGQGIQFAGKLLSYTGIRKGMEVTFLPSYGPESRGGTSSCTVVISEDEISSPIQPNPDIAVVMNKPSCHKFSGKVKPGGLLIIDSSLVPEKCGREDISVQYIPATEMAYKNGLQSSANMIIVGKLIAVARLFTTAEIEAALDKIVPDSRAALLVSNKKALKLGYEYR